jgi:hypothetical protein
MADEFVIERATRQQALLRLAISAVSGAGKTMGGLRLAKGIVDYMLERGLLSGTIDGKVGVVDTERNSASLYAHLYPFDRISLLPPYTVPRYLSGARPRQGWVRCRVHRPDQPPVGWAGGHARVRRPDAP